MVNILKSRSNSRYDIGCLVKGVVNHGTTPHSLGSILIRRWRVMVLLSGVGLVMRVSGGGCGGVI